MTDSVERPRALRRAGTWVLAFVTLAGVTAGMLALRAHLDKAHIALVYLLVVLVGSAVGGRALGLTLAGVAFLAFNFIFLPPYYTLAIEDPFDWLVLAAFLATSIVATQLLNRAQAGALEARQRAAEVERLAMLGSETLNAGRAEDALGAIAEVIRSTLRVACAEILVDRGAPPRITPVARAGACGAAAAPADDSLAAWVARMGTGAEEHHDRTMRVAPAAPGAAAPDAWGRGGGWQVTSGTRALLVPLRVRERTVGVLRIAHDEPIALDPAQQQFLDALSYYAALGVERMRLVAEAERAEALRQADALKNALIAGVSHDFRTPLTTIKGLAHRLAREGFAEGASIEEEADRLNRIVADLLDLSRLSAGGLSVHAELNAVDDLVGAAVRGVRGVAASRTIVPPRAGAGPLFGTFDLAQSVRILVNLLENALKYAPADTPIELAVAEHDGRLRIDVADRGPGIPEAERERVFEPFYRAPGAPPDVGGAGLGLAIARRLAEAQGGAVRFRPRPGGGSIFTLDLPAAQAPVLR